VSHRRGILRSQTERPEQNFGSRYWDRVAENLHTGASINEWRHYMRDIYQRLLRNWVKDIDVGRGLKTDLFEEAITPYHLLSQMGSRSIGIDCSLNIARAADQRLATAITGSLLVVADLRQLPFKSGVFQYVLSGSSLDHFPGKSDIAVSLAELSRVLTHRGVMVITFDNPHNPLVRLRNFLPSAWLDSLKLTPYHVGATYKRNEARQQFAAAGLRVTEMTAVAHAPRVLAIWLVAFVERFDWSRLAAAIGNILNFLERLERLPTRYYTGYYLAFRVEKFSSAADAIGTEDGPTVSQK
jgi:ubiquinone/menaquinone biosynthesis C-methylase UbiE